MVCKSATRVQNPETVAILSKSEVTAILESLCKVVSDVRRLEAEEILWRNHAVYLKLDAILCQKPNPSGVSEKMKEPVNKV